MNKFPLRFFSELSSTFLPEYSNLAKLENRLLVSIIRVIFLIYLLFLPSATFASTQWIKIEPGLDSIEILLIDPSNPSTLYAGIMGTVGVYKSTNSGINWSTANTGLAANGATINIHSLVIDKKNPSTLYAGTMKGVFKSTNGGGSWSRTGLIDIYVYSLAIDPIDSSILYAGTYSNGVYKSIDAGAKWSSANRSQENASIMTISIDPLVPSIVYAGTHGNGIFKSTDSGVSWKQVINGLTSMEIKTIAIDPKNPSTLYAGSYDGKIFKSIDAAITWSNISVGIPSGLATPYVDFIVIDPTNSSIIYSGVQNGGIFKSINFGQNWASFNTGMTNRRVPSFAIDNLSPTTLYAAGGEGFFKYSLTECLFNWAEGSYPQLFAPSDSATVTEPVYTYRHYSSTNNYLGISSIDNHVYYLGSDGAKQDEGPSSYWLPLAGCQSSATPFDCLFNWAERNYSALFAPAGASTATLGVYNYRHYSLTQANLGVSLLDNHVYYQGSNGISQDEGPTSYWFIQAGCQ